MESIKLRSRIGKDGILNIQIPDELKDRELEIMVIFQPIDSPAQQHLGQDINTPESRGWLPGFFEDVVGSWESEPLERPPQLPYRLYEDLSFEEDGI